MRKHIVHPAGLAKPIGYSHVAVARGTTIHVAGQVALDAEGRVVGAGDLRAQTEYVFDNLGRALAAAGATLADIVKTTIFVVGYEPAMRATIAEVRSRYLNAEAPPASTLVGVQALVRPELLIEIEAIAVIEP